MNLIFKNRTFRLRGIEQENSPNTVALTIQAQEGYLLLRAKTTDLRDIQILTTLHTHIGETLLNSNENLDLTKIEPLLSHFTGKVVNKLTSNQGTGETSTQQTQQTHPTQQTPPTIPPQPTSLIYSKTVSGEAILVLQNPRVIISPTLTNYNPHTFQVSLMDGLAHSNNLVPSIQVTLNPNVSAQSIGGIIHEFGITLQTHLNTAKTNKTPIYWSNLVVQEIARLSPELFLPSGTVLTNPEPNPEPNPNSEPKTD